MDNLPEETGEKSLALSRAEKLQLARAEFSAVARTQPRPTIQQTDPHPRLTPVILLLDVSTSMEGNPINELNRAVRHFHEQLASNASTRDSVEVAILSFSSETKLIQPFQPIAKLKPVTLATEGCTNMADGILETLNLLVEKSASFSRSRTKYARPLICMLTDGAPNDDDPDELQRATDRIHEGDIKGSRGLFSFYAVGVEGADMKTLAEISRRKPLKLQGLDFRSLFEAMVEEIQLLALGQSNDTLALPGPNHPSALQRDNSS